MAGPAIQGWWRLTGKVADPVEARMGEEYGKGQGQHRMGWGGTREEAVPACGRMGEEHYLF